MLFVMTTRMDGAVQAPQDYVTQEQRAMTQVRAECPDVEWVQNLVTTGPYDYVDVFRAPDLETAMKVATLVRSHGQGHCEVWPAAAWGEFKAQHSQEA